MTQFATSARAHRTRHLVALMERKRFTGGIALSRRRKGTSMSFRIGTSLLMLAGLAAVCQAADDRWNVYGNARYGFSICYPPSLKAQGEADNGDCNTFKSADGKVRISAYANYSIEPNGGAKALAEAFRMEVDEQNKHGFKLSYQVVKPTFYAYSGVADAGTPKARVIYHKTFERASDKLDVSLDAEYPESMKATMDPVVTRMSACLLGGKSPF